MLSEVGQKDIDSGDFFKDKELLNKCDLIIYLFSAEERVQVDFIKKTYAKIRDFPQLDLVP